jgi:hypothetical protein
VSVATGAQPPLLDTLAQPCQRTDDSHSKLRKRARAKWVTTPLAIALAELRSPLEKSYRNTVYCVETLYQDEEGKLSGKYCGNRWCLVCNRIRIARAINRYLPVLKTWQDPQLVSLTLPNVKAEELDSTITAMLRELPAIGRAMRRTDRLALRALRKMECTHNPVRDDYHPHFHVVVEGLASSLALRDRWLSLHPESSAEAQDVRPCDSRGLVEFFKYFTKLVVKLPCSNHGRPGARAFAPATALDVIFSAMKGRRVYQPMGFTTPPRAARDEEDVVGTEGDTRAQSRIGERVIWDWQQDFADWVDLATGECLTGFRPSPSGKTLMTNEPENLLQHNPNDRDSS